MAGIWFILVLFTMGRESRGALDPIRACSMDALILHYEPPPSAVPVPAELARWNR
ncbi:MAG: hypothetical protein ACLQNE_11300 [Thermoguttaceae bacterium]